MADEIKIDNKLGVFSAPFLKNRSHNKSDDPSFLANVLGDANDLEISQLILNHVIDKNDKYIERSAQTSEQAVIPPNVAPAIATQQQPSTIHRDRLVEQKAAEIVKQAASLAAKDGYQTVITEQRAIAAKSETQRGA